MTKLAWALILTSALFGLGRFFVPGHSASLPGTYEAFAHIWCGVLLSLAFTNRQYRALVIWLLSIITVIEAVKFFTR